MLQLPLLLLIQLPLAVIDHQSAPNCLNLFRSSREQAALGYLSQTLESNLMNSAKVY